MGNQPSKPADLSREIQVIGCGMSRTGTLSFSLALSRLLNGPVHHGGSAVFLREEEHIRTWSRILSLPLYPSPAQLSGIKHTLSHLLGGHVAVTDGPGSFFTAELLELYPNAKVICTIRDQDDWWASMEPVMRNAHMGILKFAFWWLPTLRWFGEYAAACERGRVKELHCREGEKSYTRDSYRYHMEYLQSIVPPERLFFYSVKEGWGPLCKMLDVPIPEEDFPRANDGKAIQDFFEAKVKLGLLVWIAIFAVLILAVIVKTLLYLGSR